MTMREERHEHEDTYRPVRANARSALGTASWSGHKVLRKPRTRSSVVFTGLLNDWLHMGTTIGPERGCHRHLYLQPMRLLWLHRQAHRNAPPPTDTSILQTIVDMAPIIRSPRDPGAGWVECTNSVQREDRMRHTNWKTYLTEKAASLLHHWCHVRCSSTSSHDAYSRFPYMVPGSLDWIHLALLVGLQRGQTVTSRWAGTLADARAMCFRSILICCSTNFQAAKKSMLPIVPPSATAPQRVIFSLRINRPVTSHHGVLVAASSSFSSACCRIRELPDL